MSIWSEVNKEFTERKCSWKSSRSQTSRSIPREGRNQRENHIVLFILGRILAATHSKFIKLMSMYKRYNIICSILHHDIIIFKMYGETVLFYKVLFQHAKYEIISPFGKIEKWRTFYLQCIQSSKNWHHVINFEWTSCSISWMLSNIDYMFLIYHIDHMIWFISYGLFKTACMTLSKIFIQILSYNVNFWEIV